MNTNLNPTIASALAPFMGSMGVFSASPTADAEDHNDEAASTFFAEVDYLGLKLTAEVSLSGQLVDVLETADGTCWYYELSESALRNILKLAQEVTA